MKKIQDFSNFKPEKKPRITAYVDEMVQRRAFARGALEGLTRSETVEKAMKEYGTPKNISYASGATITQMQSIPNQINAGAAVLPRGPISNVGAASPNQYIQTGSSNISDPSPVK